jgi:putative ABC transport system permease protein
VRTQFVRVLLTLLAYYRRHPGQTLFMAAGLVTGVALWSAVQLINDHARRSYGEADRLLGAQASHWIRGGAAGVAQGDYLALRRAGFTAVYPVIEARLQSADGALVSLIATDLLALPLGDRREDSSVANPFAAEDWLPLIQPPFEAWYPEQLAARLGVAGGERLALADGSALPPARLRQRDQQGQRVFMDVGAALALLGRTGFSYLAVGAIAPAELRRLEALLPDGLRLVENRQALDLTELTDSLHLHLSAMGLLSFAVGLFIVFNAVRFSLLARRAIFATLRELGVSVPLLAAAVAAESLLWALLGSGLGMLAGLLLAQQLLPSVAASLQSLYGAALEGQIGLAPGQMALGLLLTLAGMVLALAAPLWQRLREPVLAARSPGALLQHESRSLWRSAAAGVLLIAAAWVLYGAVDTVTGGFVVLGALLFGGAFLLPPLVSAVIAGAARVLPERRWRLRWALSDARAQLPFLRAALMALLLALTANIGVGTLVGSFRSALEGWLELRLSASIYLAGDELDPDALEGADWLLASHQRLGARLRFDGRPARVLGLSPDAPDIRSLPLAAASPGALSQWRDGTGVPAPILASEQVRHLAGRAPGSVVELDSPAGPARFRIVGFFHDYGNAGYQFYLPRGELRRHWPAAAPEGLALWVKPGAEQAAEAALLAAGARPGDWIRQSELRQVSLGVFDRTFAITGSLNGLTLMVAGLALFAGLMSLHQARLADYGHWRACGLYFREWLVVVGLPLLLMVLFTGLLALPLGLALSWLLIHRLNVIAFGWTMPLDWSWAPAGQLALTSAVVVLLTLALAAARVRRSLPLAARQAAGPGA